MVVFVTEKVLESELGSLAGAGALEFSQQADKLGPWQMGQRVNQEIYSVPLIPLCSSKIIMVKHL